LRRRGRRRFTGLRMGVFGGVPAAAPFQRLRGCLRRPTGLLVSASWGFTVGGVGFIMNGF
ncbi:MAG: hypothetical protein K2F97_08360, partial [Muribaculaceae bacterium]|nr:hypothetical protein [Muribaculaceae bacterium]